MSIVNEFNLFPTTENLLVLERKYGDSLTYYDINGSKPKKKRRSKQTDGSAGPDDKTIDGKTEGRTEQRTAQTADTRTDARTTYTDDRTVTAKSVQPVQKVTVKSDSESDDSDNVKIERDLTKRKASTDCRNSAFAQTLRMRQTGTQENF